MTAQCLESVMKNGRVAALLKAREKLSQRSRGLIANAGQVRDGEELERRCRNIHAMALSCSIETEAARFGYEKSKDVPLFGVLMGSAAPQCVPEHRCVFLSNPIEDAPPIGIRCARAHSSASVPCV